MILQLMRILVYGPAFALLWAIPGALVGLGAGYFHLHTGAAFGLAIAMVLIFPRSRRRRGEPADFVLYLMTAYGAAGIGLGCYFVGRFISELRLAG